METLVPDLKRLLVTYLSLADKRTLLRVSKACYWWIHPYVRIQSVPLTGKFIPSDCVLCHDDLTRPAKARLNKRDVCNVEESHFGECSYGHRFICHVKDNKTVGPCPKCGNYLKKQKRASK